MDQRVPDVDIWRSKFGDLAGQPTSVTVKYDGCQLVWESVDGRLSNLRTHNGALIAVYAHGDWDIKQPKFNGADIAAILVRYTADVTKNLKKAGVDTALYCELIHPKAGTLMKTTYPPDLINTCIFFQVRGPTSTRPGFTPDLFEGLPVPEVIYTGVFSKSCLDIVAAYLIANHKTTEGAVFAFKESGYKLRTALTESGKGYLQYIDVDNWFTIPLNRMRAATSSKKNILDTFLHKANTHGDIDIEQYNVDIAAATDALMKRVEAGIRAVAIKEETVITNEDGTLQEWVKGYIRGLSAHKLAKQMKIKTAGYMLHGMKVVEYVDISDFQADGTFKRL